MVVGANLGDPAVAHPKPLGPAVEARLARPGVAPGHRPLDHGLVALLDAVLEEPLAVDHPDAELRVLSDALGPLVRPEPRVVMDGVVREVGCDQLRIPRVQRLVVRADVVEVAHGRPFISPFCRSEGRPVVVRLNAASVAAPNRREPMNFMVTLITDGSAMAEMTPEERDEFARRMGEFMGEIRSADVLLHTDALAPVSDARTLRRKSGKVVVTDGPFAETKEQIAGYMVLSCKDMDDAVGWIERMPVAGGAVEVRPLAGRSDAP